jgi:uncharacterized membrane protein YgaE (UPF0421/DUF939 family)
LGEPWELVNEAADMIERLEAGNREFSFLRNDDLARIKELEAQVARLKAAIDDVASYVSRADYYYMQPQTIEVMRENRAALEGKDG